jgi:hypothetical protein
MAQMQALRSGSTETVPTPKMALLGATQNETFYGINLCTRLVSIIQTPRSPLFTGN